MPDVYSSELIVRFDSNTKVQVLSPVYQYDHGRKLYIYGLDLTKEITVQYTYLGISEAVTIAGRIDGDCYISPIPDAILMQDERISAYIYVEDELSGITIFEIKIPIIPRARPTSLYTPEEIDSYNKVVAELGVAIQEIEDIKREIDQAVLDVEEATGAANTAASRIEELAQDADQAVQDAEKAIRDAQEAIDNILSENSSSAFNQSLNNSIIYEIPGNVISISDASDLPLYELNIYGKTTQSGTPAPDAPVPLVSAGKSGDVGVSVTGKNLFSASKQHSASNATVSVDGDIVTIAANRSINYAFVRFFCVTNPKPGTEFTLSIGEIGISAKNFPRANVIFMVNDENKAGQGLDNAGTTRIIIPEYSGNGELRVVLYANAGGTVNEGDYCTYKNVQLEVGSIATNYEPYKDGGSVALSTPNGLPGIPVSSGGNYTDENGQQWICDEIDLERGVYAQRIKSEILDGDEIWSAGTHYFIHYIQDIYDAAKTGLLCTGHLYSTKSTGTLAVNEMTQGSNPRNVCFGNPDDMALDAWKAALAETPLTLIYPLAAPIETALSDAVIAAYQAMHTNKLNTTVMNDGGAGMRMAYAADTKTYIDRQHDSLASNLEQMASALNEDIDAQEARITALEQGGTGGSSTPGKDGISPTVTVTAIDGGHRVSITDATGTQTFDVMDGADGQPGSSGENGSDYVLTQADKEEIAGMVDITVSGVEIDDNSVSTLTTYSSQKIHTEMNDLYEDISTQNERISSLEDSYSELISMLTEQGYVKNGDSPTFDTVTANKVIGAVYL